MKHRHHLALAGLWLAAAVPAAAADPAQLATLFGTREAVSGLQLSPDGTRVSYVTPMPDGRSAVVVVDVATGQARPVISDASSPTLRLRWCTWKSHARLICRLQGVVDDGGTLLGVGRTVALDPDGGNAKELGQQLSSRMIGYNQNSGSIIDWLPDDPDSVLMQVQVLPEITAGTHLAKTAKGLAARRFNINTGRSATTERAEREAARLVTDGRGRVRIRAMIDLGPDGRLERTLRYQFRTKDGSDWRALGSVDLTANTTFEVDGIDESGDWVFVLKPKDGRTALYRMAIDGSGREELVFAHPVVDATGVRRIGKYGRAVAAEYVTDATELAFFDPALKALTASLSRALPQHPSVSVLDESWDGAKKLVFASSDVDPGRYYLFDTATRRLDELTPVRPQLDGLQLATVQPVSYPARDKVAVPSYLTLPPGKEAKNLPLVVMPHGGPAARDSWGFDWLAQYFAQLGYAVLQPNFRGSSGYGEAWYARNGFQSWETAIGDINDGARWLVAQGIADPQRLAIFGWSYGGYAALQANVLDPDLYKAAVAVAPVTDLAALQQDARDFTNYHLVRAFIGTGPHVTAGSPACNVERIKAPVLLFHGDRDINVDVQQARLMDAALARAGKAHELVVYPGLDHQLDDSKARADLLKRSAAFLAAQLGR